MGTLLGGMYSTEQGEGSTSNVAETPTGCEKHSLDSARDFCKLVCGVALGEGSQHATQFAVWFV